MMLPLLFLACTVENQVQGKDDSPFDPGDTAPDTAPETAETGDTAAPPVEDCDGVDNDGDSAVDEGFPDADGDGWADCVDQECPALDAGLAQDVPTRAECSRAEDPWSVRTLWSATSTSAFRSDPIAGSTPVAVQLDDDNGDGVIDEDDTPALVGEVTTTTWTEGHTVAVDGATGAELWTAPAGSIAMDTVAADLDGDGVAELVTVDPMLGYAPRALRADGTVLWEGPANTFGDYGSVTVADLEGDGKSEVLSGGTVYEGETGARRLDLAVGYGYTRWGVGDLDLDGDQEMAYLGGLWDSDGTELGSLPAAALTFAFPAVVQADDDPEGEVAWSADHYYLMDSDGTVLVDADLFAAASTPGPPCAADFDGDGQTELVAPRQTRLLMLELDGTAVWEVAVSDSSSQAGCVAADLDGDGAAEVIFADEQRLSVFDGRSGALRFEVGDHLSMTWSETPLVADLDADGHVEIAFTSNTDWDRRGAGQWVTVLDNDGPGWAGGSTGWACHDQTGQIDATGAVSVWDYWNSRGFREQPTWPVDGAGLPDATVAFTDRCLADCYDGPLLVSAQVSNQGVAELPAGSVLTLYARDGETLTELDQRLLEAVPAGRALDGITWELPIDAPGADGLRLVLSPSAEDCDPSNEIVDLTEPGCP